MISEIDLGWLPVAWVWIDRRDGGADRNLERLLAALHASGVDDVRPRILR